jgi:lipopolysaccharide/colanic/teichoic acid biosynthesis glycosyltransferase
MSSCRFLLVEDVHDLQRLWLRMRMLGGAIGIEITRELGLRHNQVLNRAIDIPFAIPIALLVWPIIVVLAFAIKLADPAPRSTFSRCERCRWQPRVAGGQ